MAFAPHVRRLSGKCFFHQGQIRTVRRSLTKDAAQILVHAFISSRIYYCNSILYGMSAAHMQPLQNVLNAAARVVLQKRKFDHISIAVRDQLHCLTVAQRIAYMLCMHSINVCDNAHRHILQTCVCSSQPMLVDVTFIRRHMVTWWFPDQIRRHMDSEVFWCLVHHFGTRYYLLPMIQHYR